MANFNINKAIIGGRLTADPELKTTQNGVSVTSFSIAVKRQYNKGEQITDFVDAVAWRNTAELVCKYFRKGSSICVVGEVQTRNFEDKNGNKRKATEIKIDEVYFVDSKNDGQQATNAANDVPLNTFMSNAAAQGVDVQDFEPDDDLPF